MKRAILLLIFNRASFLILLLLYQVIGWLSGVEILPFSDVAGVAIGVCLLNLFFLWLSRHTAFGSFWTKALMLTQFLTDAVLVSVLVIISGGMFSRVSLGYLVVILLSSVYYAKMYIYLVTVFCVFCYFVAVWFFPFFLSKGLTVDGIFDLPSEVGISVLVQFVLFFSTALASVFLQSVYRHYKGHIALREKQLRSLRRLQETIVQRLHSGLFTSEWDGEVTFANQRASELLQRHALELVGMNAWDVLHLEGGDIVHQLKERPFARLEHWVQIQDSRRLFGTSVSQIQHESGEEGLMFIFQDLTEIKMLEQQARFEERMSSIGKVAAGVAHEIRNPLASISGSVQVLRELLPLDQTAHELAQIVVKETERLNEIISQFLVYARPGSPARMRPFNIYRCCQNLLKVAKNDWRASQMEFKLTLKGQLRDMTVLGDEQKVVQVFWNLLRNACQAMDNKGCCTIFFSLEEGNVRMEVQDTGIGLSEEQLKDVFTPFQSFHKGGSGLGLSVVYEIVQMHHGKIAIHSQLNQGTTVVVLFPRYVE